MDVAAGEDTRPCDSRERAERERAAVQHRRDRRGVEDRFVLGTAGVAGRTENCAAARAHSGGKGRVDERSNAARTERKNRQADERNTFRSAGEAGATAGRMDSVQRCADAAGDARFRFPAGAECGRRREQTYLRGSAGLEGRAICGDTKCAGAGESFGKVHDSPGRLHGGAGAGWRGTVEGGFASRVEQLPRAKLEIQISGLDGLTGFSEDIAIAADTGRKSGRPWRRNI